MGTEDNTSGIRIIHTLPKNRINEIGVDVNISVVIKQQLRLESAASVERISRQGYPLGDYPLEDLAMMMGVFLFFERSYKELHHILLSIDPGIGLRHKEITGLEFTVSKLQNRIDKGMRNLEMKNYRFLIPRSIHRIEEWLGEGV